MSMALSLSGALRQRIADEARAAWPGECCGLIEGVRDGGRFEALALHPMANSRPEPDRFEIDPAAHIALRKALRGTGRAVIGCYHSHPGGRPEPSSQDRENGGFAEFLWLIAGLSGPSADIELGAFDGEGFEPVRLVEAPPSLPL